MSQFEYLMVLVSIIIGLGITTLLSGTTRMLKAHGLSRLYWVHVVWILAILIWHIGVWAFRWELRGRAAWSFGDTLVFLLVPIGLFVVADLCFPDSEAPSPDDLRSFYFGNSHVFFGAAAILELGAALTWISLYDAGWFASEVVISVLGAILAVFLTRTDREVAHQVAAIAALIAITLHFSSYQIQT